MIGKYYEKCPECSMIIKKKQLSRTIFSPNGIGTKSFFTSSGSWRIILDSELVPVMPTPRRAFQGWRYLEPDEAPADLTGRAAKGLANLPPKMRKELAELGLL